MIKDQFLYMEDVLSEIQEAKNNGRSGIYRINHEISDTVANYVKAYFLNNPAYRVEIKKCQSCRNTWDIMIYFIG